MPTVLLPFAIQMFREEGAASFPVMFIRIAGATSYHLLHCTALSVSPQFSLPLHRVTNHYDTSVLALGSLESFNTLLTLYLSISTACIMLSLSLRRRSAPGSAHVRERQDSPSTTRFLTPSVSSKKSLGSLFSTYTRDGSSKFVLN
jgi:hypothetical protein